MDSKTSSGATDMNSNSSSQPATESSGEDSEGGVYAASITSGKKMC